jgi:hypothetical protein
MKSLSVALSGAGKGLWKGEGRWWYWTDLIKVQCKAIQNWQNEPPLYYECMLIKMEKGSIIEYYIYMNIFTALKTGKHIYKQPKSKQLKTSYLQGKRTSSDPQNCRSLSASMNLQHRHRCDVGGRQSIRLSGEVVQGQKAACLSNVTLGPGLPWPQAQSALKPICCPLLRVLSMGRMFINLLQD